jgi:hypothetical protein
MNSAMLIPIDVAPESAGEEEQVEPKPLRMVGDLLPESRPWSTNLSRRLAIFSTYLAQNATSP